MIIRFLCNFHHKKILDFGILKLERRVIDIGPIKFYNKRFI